MLVDLRHRVLAFLRENFQGIGNLGKVSSVFPGRLNRPEIPASFGCGFGQVERLLSSLLGL
jgi:hypothetical protein